jgi:hypothetical protein
MIAYRQRVAGVPSVAEAISRMEAIVAPLPRADGVACFTRLYLAVTQGVEADLAGVALRDPRFLERLDIAFAQLYFDALDSSARDPQSTPRAWVPLLEARSRRGIEPLQFALAGMNAHINRDLPVALVTTCRELGITLEPSSPQHADYLRINSILGEVEARVKKQYLTGWMGALDRLLLRAHRLDDVIAMWDISRARDAAWTTTETLWALRDEPRLEAECLASVDRMVGFAGRGLLVPADTWLLKLTRRLRPAM